MGPPRRVKGKKRKSVKLGSPKRIRKKSVKLGSPRRVKVRTIKRDVLNLLDKYPLNNKQVKDLVDRLAVPKPDYV